MLALSHGLAWALTVVDRQRETEMEGTRKKTLLEALKTATSRITEEDARSLLLRKKEIDLKINDVPDKLRKMVRQAGLLFEMMKDYWSGEYRKIPWCGVAMAVAALMYVLNPADIIPDVLLGLGYVDDAAVIALAVKATQEDLRRYCVAKDLDPRMYFDS